MARSLQQDTRAALRSLRKTPGFTAVAILSLAVAIGANTTVFSVVNGLLLRPLAPRDNAALASLYIAEKDRGWRPFSHAEYLALREASDTFADVAASFPTFASIADPTGGLHRGVAFFVSENYFNLLGVTPQLGRFFTAGECRPNARQAVVVASHALWQRLGARADFVGSTLRINGQTYTVVGIAPPDFSGFNVFIATDCWVPLGVFGDFGGSAFGESHPDLARPDSYTLFVTARLAPHITLVSASTRLSALASALPAPGNARELAIAHPSRENIGSFQAGSDTTVHLAFSFLAVSGCVLLIAGFNLGNLLLSRGADRAREIALRTALGATRGRIVRQLLTEGLLLACGGGLLGFALSLGAAHWIYAAGAHLNATRCTFALNLSPDVRVLAVTVCCCLLAALFFSFVPALRASRIDLARDLQQGGPAAVSGLGRFFAWRHLVLMAQVALALTVVFLAALFARGAWRADNLPRGFDPTAGIVAELDYSLEKTSFAATFRSLAAAVDCARQHPGVSAAAATTLLPFDNINVRKIVEPSSSSAGTAAADTRVSASYAAVTSGYFDALGVRLLRGRDFTATDVSDPASRYVAIIDEALAHRLFPAGDALGQHLRKTGRSNYSTTPSVGAAPEFEIIGICTSHRHDLQTESPASLYVPFAVERDYRGSVYLQVRTGSAEPATLAALNTSLRRAWLAGQPKLPLVEVAPFTTRIARHVPLAMAHFGSIVLGVFGGVALLLAVTGIYGVKTYAVARRTREIGIRVALGASPRAAFNVIFRQALLQTTLSLAIGALLALAAGRALGSFVYGARGTDPLALAAAAGTLGGAALAACWLPARRATRVDPIVALRSE